MNKLYKALMSLSMISCLASCSATQQRRNMTLAESSIASEGDQVLYDFACRANRDFKLAYDFAYQSDYKTCVVIGDYTLWAEGDPDAYAKYQVSYDIFLVADNGHVKTTRYWLGAKVSYGDKATISFRQNLQFDYIGQSYVGSSWFWDSEWVDASLDDVLEEFMDFPVFYDDSYKNDDKDIMVYTYDLQLICVE